MRTSRVSFTAAATLLLLGAGCARAPAPATGPSPATASASDSTGTSHAIAVQVDNQNFAEMDVYLLNGGARWLVGQVGGMSKRTLTVPASLVPADDRIRFRAEAIGGAGATTTPVMIVPPGQQVYWTIGADPAMSSVSAG